jgi:thymidylate synthase (FAD)
MLVIDPTQAAAIESAREAPVPTLRATVQALEDILYKPFAALDHGFLRVIDYMGDDNAVVQAARVSYGKG